MPVNNTVPYEVIAAPFEVYWANVGTAFPDVDTDPSASWTRLGTSGSLNITEAGVTVSHGQETVEWRASGDTGTRKVFRTSESLKVKLILADLSLEQYRHALNMNSVIEVNSSIGSPGYKKLGLSKGQFVAQVALLVRGPSAYGDGWNSQYEIPIAFQTGNPEPVFGVKGEPAGLALEWTAIIDPSASATERFGRLVVQDEAADT